MPTPILFLYAVIADISATKLFYFILFGTMSVGNSKAAAASNWFLWPSGTSLILIEERAAWTPESSQSIISKIYLTLCLVLGNWCWTFSEQRWSMVYDAWFWLLNACRDNCVFPVHFQSPRIPLCLLSLDPNGMVLWIDSLGKGMPPFHSRHVWMVQSLQRIEYAGLPRQCVYKISYCIIHRDFGYVAGAAPSSIWLIHGMSHEYVQWPV